MSSTSNTLERHCYPMAPLIRGTLVLLYLALVLPLPALAPADLRPWLLVLVPLGRPLVAVTLGVLSVAELLLLIYWSLPRPWWWGRGG